MIICENGELKIEGNKMDLTMEVAGIIKALIQEQIIDKDMMHSMIEAACMTPKELRRELDIALGRMITHLLTEDDNIDGVEQSSERTNHAKEMLNIIKEVQRRKK